MDVFESSITDEHIIRKSIAVLLVEGAFVWLMLVLVDYGFDQLPSIANTLNELGALSATLNVEYLSSIRWYISLSINSLFGLVLLYMVLGWIFDYYIVRPDSIVVRHGIIFTHESSYQIEDVKTIEVYQGFWGKILNTGSVSFLAYRAEQHVVISHINYPWLVAEHIQRLHPAVDSVPIASSTKPPSRRRYLLGGGFKRR